MCSVPAFALVVRPRVGQGYQERGEMRITFLPLWSKPVYNINVKAFKLVYQGSFQISLPLSLIFSKNYWLSRLLSLLSIFCFSSLTWNTQYKQRYTPRTANFNWQFVSLILISYYILPLVKCKSSFELGWTVPLGSHEVRTYSWVWIVQWCVCVILYSARYHKEKQRNILVHESKDTLLKAILSSIYER